VPLERLAVKSRNAAEFQRTLSRLIEMQSRDYLEAAHRPG
jgi:predicted ATPase